MNRDDLEHDPDRRGEADRFAHVGGGLGFFQKVIALSYPFTENKAVANAAMIALVATGPIPLRARPPCADG